MFKRVCFFILLSGTLSMSAFGAESLTDALAEDITTIEHQIHNAHAGKQLLTYLATNIKNKITRYKVDNSIITDFNLYPYLGLRNGIKNKHGLNFTLSDQKKSTPQQEKTILLAFMILSTNAIVTKDNITKLLLDPFNPVTVFLGKRNLWRDSETFSAPPINNDEAIIIHRFVLCIYYESLRYFRGIASDLLDEEVNYFDELLEDNSSLEYFSKTIREDLKRNLLQASDLNNPGLVKRVFDEKITKDTIKQKVKNALYFYNNFLKYSGSLDNTHARQPFINYMSSGDKIATSLVE